MEETPELQLTIRVAAHDHFIKECEQRAEEERLEFRRGMTEEQLESLRSWLEVSRSANKAKREERRKNKEESNRRHERDGWAVSDRYFGGFFTNRRRADGGTRAVHWGKDPLMDGSWVVLSFNGEKAISCFKLNMEISDGWVAEDEEVIALEVTNDLFKEKERSLFIILDSKGCVLAHKQFPTARFKFLGISETGSHYVWKYEDWLHVTHVGNGTDFLNRRMPMGFSPNVADFDSYESRIRFREYGGNEFTISWEDSPDGDLDAFTNTFHEESRPEHKAEMIKNFWRSHPEPNKEFACYLLPMFDEIDPDALRDDSLWNSVTRSVYWMIGGEICEEAGDIVRAQEFRTNYREYRNPFVTAQDAPKGVKEAIDAADSEKIGDWQKKLDTAIGGGRLAAYPHLAARCLRYNGEIAEYHGKLYEARSYYSEALALDDAAGCKKKLSGIVKRLHL